MAGFAEPDTVPTQRILYRTATEREPPSRRALPNGPCNYRDASVGPCGCDQFWDKSSAELHDGSTLHRPANERVPWCVCGHHACFHLRTPRAPEQPAPAMQMGTKHLGQQVNVDEAQSNNDERIQKSFYGGSQRHQRTAASEANGPGRMLQSRDTPSQLSSSGLPGLPSMCMLSNDRRPATNDEARPAVNKPRGSVAGLGLSMLNMESMPSIDRQQSASPTVADDSIPPPLQRAFSEPERSSTRGHSVPTDSITLLSDLRGPFEQIKDFNRNLHLDVAGDTIPNTLDPHEFLPSATEIATPSIRGTPDLGAADNAVQQGKKLIDTLSRLTSSKPGPQSSPDKTVNITSVPSRHLKSPSIQQEEQLQNVLRAASPRDLQKLVSYLAPLHNLLNSIPNVAKTMRELSHRLDVLENGSFNYVQPEDLHQTLEMYDDRLISVEHRIDEHEKMHQALDADSSSISHSRRRVDNVTGSFNSNYSLQSTTSSALILAAMERKDKEAEIGDIKGRLEVLESAAVPTTLNPWEVEVVLLPWGRELRGIWFSPDQPMHDSSKTTTQDSEEWTQARNLKPVQSLQNLRETGSSPTGTKGIFSDTESGWSSQAISDWASGSTDDWLYPKACGANNLVYKRLLSRGFIRTVTLHSANARDIQATLSHAFSDVMEWLHFTDRDEDQMVAAHPALKASFIPLRKVMKESKLRFLTPSEMSSSALWSAQFLAAGVVMRVSGGKRRLYVTQREAYVQRSDEMGSSWTWQELRQLPRYQPGQDSKMEGNDEHCQSVPEADAKEACWQYNATYDAPPPSVESSFSSHQSVDLSMRPADRQWRRSITPSSILKNRQQQPLSPLSLFHQQRPRSLSRTASASVLEIPGSAKRRLNSSPTKHPASQPLHSREASVSAVRSKRRRVTGSSSPREEVAAPEMGPVTIWNPTPRRSREPPSPHFTHPALPRSSSDVTSRPSQRSVTRTSNPAAFAYATPASGPFLGGPAFGGYNQGGDTEPDESAEDRDDGEDADDDDDGEQSWHGVTDGDEVSVSSSSDSNAEAGAQEMVSFSGDDSGFDSENDASASDGDRTPTGRGRRLDDDDDDDDDDGVEIFDTLLEVLEPNHHQCTLYECDSSC